MHIHIYIYADASDSDSKSQGQYEATVFRETQLKDFDASRFETKQVFYTSKDGTRIPMFVISKKDLVLDGSHPTLLYGYGGFNISLTPSCSISRLVFVQNLGGVVCVPNLRGGGEYGNDWHKAGTKLKKQNVFDDFIAAAEFLIEQKYTSSAKLSIMGGSNGGLLVGACLNQRPELYGCGIAAVGVMDMLKFHKFTIGYAWCSDFGCSDNEDEYNALKAYSPVHNINADTPYPATLLTTADHDDRVVPLHSFKYMAALQHVVKQNSAQVAPVIIRIECKAGHGAGKPLHKIIDEQADIYGFIAKSVGASWRK